MCVRLRVGICTQRYTSVFVREYICIYIHMKYSYICSVCKCIYVYTYIYIYIIYTYTYTYMYVNICIYIHIYILIPMYLHLTMLAGLSKDASRQAKKSKLLVSRGLPRLLALVCERASESEIGCSCECVVGMWERKRARAPVSLTFPSNIAVCCTMCASWSVSYYSVQECSIVTCVFVCVWCVYAGCVCVYVCSVGGSIRSSMMTTIYQSI